MDTTEHAASYLYISEHLHLFCISGSLFRGIPPLRSEGKQALSWHGDRRSRPHRNASPFSPFDWEGQKEKSHWQWHVPGFGLDFGRFGLAFGWLGEFIHVRMGCWAGVDYGS